MATWIETPDALRDLADVLARESVVAMDTESDSLYHFRERVCLIQVGLRSGAAVLVDPLALGDLAPLGAVTARPAVEVCLHGAHYDLACLKRDFGWSFANLFDTMVASRFLGERDFGLAACLRRELGVEVSKDERTADWSRRPLDPAQEAYALADVTHLVALRDRLVDRLRAAGREAWVREECRVLAETPAAASEPEPPDPLRAPGARDLDPRGLAVLGALFEAREDLCRRTNRPRYRVVGDQDLVHLAAASPRTREELLALCGLPQNLRRQPEVWLAAIRRGLQAPPIPLPPPPPRPPLDPLVGLRIARLRAWRPRASEGLGLDPGLLLPNRLLVALAQAGPRTLEDLRAIEGLRAWRVEVLGEDLLRLLR